MADESSNKSKNESHSTESSEAKAKSRSSSKSERVIQPNPINQPEMCITWGRLVENKINPFPDEWVVRNLDLIPLTGIHPFNAEPPTNLLMKEGLITPNGLHYVRNHAGVPKLKWETHKVLRNNRFNLTTYFRLKLKMLQTTNRFKWTN